MTVENFAHEQVHHSRDSATHPIELPWRTLAALLLLVGLSPQRPAQAKRRAHLRLALPAHAMTAHSGASNCGF